MSVSASWTNLKIDHALRSMDLGEWLVAGSGVELFVDDELLVLVSGREDGLRVRVLDVSDYEDWIAQGGRGQPPGDEVCLLGQRATLRVCAALRRLCPSPCMEDAVEPGPLTPLCTESIPGRRS